MKNSKQGNPKINQPQKLPDHGFQAQFGHAEHGKMPKPVPVPVRTPPKKP